MLAHAEQPLAKWLCVTALGCLRLIAPSGGKVSKELLLKVWMTSTFDQEASTPQFLPFRIDQSVFQLFSHIQLPLRPLNHPPSVALVPELPA